MVSLTSQTQSIQDRVYSGGKNDDILVTEQPSGYGLLTMPGVCKGTDIPDHSRKMYSDDIVATDPRAQVVMGDFTVDEPTRGRGRGGGGGRGKRGRGTARRAGATGTKMDIDR